MHEGDMICQDTKYDDFDILRETLQELIKLIRFYQMDRDAFIPDVWEYVNILPNDLVKDVLRCYLDSNAKPLYQQFLIRLGNFKIDSVSINKEIAQLLTKWIDKKSRNDKIAGFQYNFNLLFRSGLDGLSSQTFHRKCDNKGATIVVARIQNSNLLIGGYNPLDWIGKKVWKQTTDSFIFVIDPNELKTAIISRVNHNYSGFAIYCDHNEGPSFGEGPDLQVQNNSTICRVNPKTYPKFLNMDSHYLTILDYEVFQVVDSITGLSIQGRV
ncbi:15670_t:CDS:1 [Racocetra fulgida]|uniref:15670_t:CDS:1 n=1 Tax=Racocetra fulgida TaxID=60492 RepID=A0A9N9AFX1_9GLOM|nr:15670_t:CDS:1 [Racocetra fulgida]